MAKRTHTESSSASTASFAIESDRDDDVEDFDGASSSVRLNSAQYEHACVQCPYKHRLWSHFAYVLKKDPTQFAVHRDVVLVDTEQLITGIVWKQHGNAEEVMLICYTCASKIHNTQIYFSKDSEGKLHLSSHWQNAAKFSKPGSKPSANKKARFCQRVADKSKGKQVAT